MDVVDRTIFVACAKNIYKKGITQMKNLLTQMKNA